MVCESSCTPAAMLSIRFAGTIPYSDWSHGATGEDFGKQGLEASRRLRAVTSYAGGCTGIGLEEDCERNAGTKRTPLSSALDRGT